jgi:hypothetical protein
MQHSGNTVTILAIATAVVALAILPYVGTAQTIRPVIVETKGPKTNGRFELINDQQFPVNVILEAKSFNVNEAGEPTYRPLDKSVHLKLSEMSFRIPPGSSRNVFFEARAESLPAWFTIYATFAGLPSHQGIAVEVELPHTVYMLPKEPLSVSDVTVESAVWDSVAHQVSLRLRNASGRMGRVVEAAVTAKRERREAGSFPLLPHATRTVQIKWDAPTPPTAYRLRFQRFTVEDSLRAG